MSVSRYRDMWRNRLNRETIYSTSEYWDSKAAEYEGDAASMWPNNNLNVWYNIELTTMFKEFLGDVNGLRILDVGCGTGRNSRFFAERGASVVGIDFSPKSIEIARRRPADGNPVYRVQSLFELEEDNVFDAAISWGTITFACRNRAELEDALSRIARSLKSGGRLLLCEPVHRGFLHRVLNMNMRQFSAALSDAGFKSEKIRNLHFWPMRLVLAYINWPRLITKVGYQLGQSTMAIFGKRCFGDYKAIYATVRKSGRTSIRCRCDTPG
jgi:SAM-dependent methyltransferase